MTCMTGMSFMRGERPILFGEPMVLAILDGRKTQTRRIVRPAHDMSFGCELAPCEIAGEVNGGDFTNSRFRPGDRLWVREAWCPIWPQDAHYNANRPIAIDYRAGHGPDSDQWRLMDIAGTRRWKPSIHMPRWASRIALDVTGVRIERLRDIGEADAQAEGVYRLPCHGGGYKFARGEQEHDSAREAYRALWELLHGPGAWDKNPWVWVVTFRRVECCL